MMIMTMIEFSVSSPRRTCVNALDESDQFAQSVDKTIAGGHGDIPSSF